MKNKIRNLQTKVLSNDWATLKKVSYQYLREDGIWEDQTREAYDRGDGATVLLYSTESRKIILTRQFRLPTYLNGNDDGMMIETCAGKLEDEDPAECVRRETEEETGYRIKEVNKVFEVYMSPGSVTEKITFFTAPYSASMKRHEGGGNSAEQENIQVLEISLDDALSLVDRGEIQDAKTIMLLQYAKLKNLI